VILDTKGNIFGGFTPVKWKSRRWNGKEGNEDNRRKGDDSLKSFVFTIRNPHGISPKRFGLKTEAKSRAIVCDVNWGPWFNGGIAISRNCNANTKSVTSLGVIYVNDTEIDGEEIFTGSREFQAKEIETFELKD
jgi:hypothetical protein